MVYIDTRGPWLGAVEARRRACDANVPAEATGLLCSVVALQVMAAVAQVGDVVVGDVKIDVVYSR